MVRETTLATPIDLGGTARTQYTRGRRGSAGLKGGRACLALQWRKVVGMRAALLLLLLAALCSAELPSTSHGMYDNCLIR